jgi:crotonobetainyl-CoA:carnitine CoA-transferase CaiB-like acyl-CoA transferase
MTALPLAGCRVLDLGIITAGAATSALLADLGADVVKVESPRYRDPFRGWSASRAADDQPVQPFFAWTNRNKRGISLDLKRAEGRQAFLRLAAASDIVVENFSRGVLERLGLDYANLRAVNPQVILASISSAGETGPDAGHVSYGTTLEAVSGLAWSSGYADGEPVVTGRDLNYPDQVVAIFAAGMIVTAWRAKRAGAGGTHLDLAQRELTSFLCGETFVQDGAQEDVPRTGNAQEPYPVQDCFRSSEGAWLAVTVDAANAPALAGLVGVATCAARDRIREWCASQTANAAVAQLTHAGIAAAPVLTGEELLRDAGRLWSFALDRAPDGELLKGFPFQLRQTPLSIKRAAPAICADTAEVLAMLGGFSAAEIAALARDGVIELAGGAAAEGSRDP